ncbi:MAG: sodium-dependent transporter [Ruminococcaceae bacterium]|nr:sodium-dependent transporter [Oscillospiraceae bacterium]
MSNNRGSFSGKIGFVLAAAGSAVGLGNLWRFPYLAAQYGGGIFLLVYLILTITFGFALMTAEIAIGRKAGLSVVGAYRYLDKRFSFMGYISAIIPMIILPYYSVIGGWVTKYLFAFATGDSKEAISDTYFSTFTSKPIEPLIWFLIFIALTAIVVLFGVDKGVERVSKVMMPVLVVLTIFISIYTMFLPGALEGVKYYLTPDISKFSVKTVLAAMGQLFYSMSISMGIMITFGSYLKKDVSIEKSVKSIEWFDTGIAFFAGLMIVPAVFAFSGGNEEALGQGPGLMFVTLPKVFDVMAGGTFMGITFFLLVLLAALTSSISLMETIVSIFQDKLGLGRKMSCLIVIGICLLLGIPSSLGSGIWSEIKILGFQFLDFFDFISNSVLMPIVALITCIFVGYIIKPKSLIEEVELSGPFKRKNLFVIVIKYFAPVCIVLILISSILSGFGIWSI